MKFVIYKLLSVDLSVFVLSSLFITTSNIMVTSTSGLEEIRPDNFIDMFTDLSEYVAGFLGGDLSVRVA